MLLGKHEDRLDIRKQYELALHKRLSEEFAGEDVTLLQVAELQLNRSYAYLRVGKTLIIGVNDFERKRTQESILSIGLCFYHMCADSKEHSLLVVLPQRIEPSSVDKLRKRIACLKIPVKLWQLSYFMLDISKTKIPSLKELIAAESDIYKRISDDDYFSTLAPNEAAAKRITDAIKQAVPKVETRYFRDYVSFRLLGLEFARLRTPKDMQKWRLQIGIGNKRKDYGVSVLDSALTALTSLANGISINRSGGGRKNSKYFLAQNESWLESLIRQEPRVINESLYNAEIQVPTALITSSYSQNSRHFIDILAIDSRGSLWLLELKTRTDLHSIMQAIDYWLWVESVKEQLQQCGYFRGASLNTRRKTRVCVVIPENHYSRELGIISSYLKKTIPFAIMLVNKNWKKKLRVLSVEETQQVVQSSAAPSAAVVKARRPLLIKVKPKKARKRKARGKGAGPSSPARG